MTTAESTTIKTDLDRFFDLLENYPRLKGFWNKEKRTVDLKILKAPLSSGERILANILISIWKGKAPRQQEKIDFTDLATLSPEYVKPLLKWVVDPCWP